MKANEKPVLFSVGIALVVVFSILHGSARGEPNGRDGQTIQHLMAYVAESGLTFVRNGRRYSPLEAAEHMDNKYRHFMDEIRTPEDFILLCATESLLTGEPYLIIDEQGVEMKTSEWLKEELYRYRGHDR